MVPAALTPGDIFLIAVFVLGVAWFQVSRAKRRMDRSIIEWVQARPTHMLVVGVVFMVGCAWMAIAPGDTPARSAGFDRFVGIGGLLTSTGFVAWLLVRRSQGRRPWDGNTH